jgi:2-polyprenyl-3-methyl-5-hydroxy-6-metoxy-1,4-benzoquinol methylase
VNKILDAGCGEGFVAKYLISGNKNLSLEGIDISEQAIAASKRFCPEGVFRIGDICNSSYPDRSFDLVLAIEVIEHLPDPGIAIAEVKRISRRYAMFSVPLEPYYRLCNLLLGKNINRLGSPPEHIWNWSRGQFYLLLSKYFGKIKLKVSFPWIIAVCEV